MTSRYVCVMAGVMAMTLGASARGQAQSFVPVSVATDGTVGNASSYGGVFSGDGRFVAFASNATNLVAGDTNGKLDVFVRDLVGHTTERVSVTQAGAERVGDSGVRGVSLSADGTFVAFASRAPLVDADTNSCPPLNGDPVNCSDIYVRNRTTGAVERVSIASDGTQANDESGEPSISADGRYVVFASSATNLVAGDQNGVADVFLHDRVTHTTTRLSVSSTGAELTLPSLAPRISADGQTVLFTSYATGIVTDPDTLPCPSTGVCLRAYLLDRATGVLSRIAVPAAAGISSPTAPAVLVGTVGTAALTSDGRYVTLTLAPNDGYPSISFFTALPQNAVVFDRLTQRFEWRRYEAPVGVGVFLNESGRYLTMPGAMNTVFQPMSPAIRLDRLGGVNVTLPAQFELGGTDEREAGQFSPDGLSVLVSVPDALVAGDTNNTGDLYLIQRDLDNDGMPDDWETFFGLNPASATDATLDADGDGVSNLQEYRDGTNPKGMFKRYFAEGAANAFFTTHFALFNPGDQPAIATLEFLGSNRLRRSVTVALPAHARTTIVPSGSDATPPDNDFSTIVDADRQVVADRTMTWDSSGYGSSAETAIETPGTTWYLAEGSTGGSFDLFYLLQNPGDVDATVPVSYLLPAPAAPIVKQYQVPAKSRKTIYVDQEGAALAATDVSAKITSDQPILAERSMYFSTPTQPFAAGHEGAAVAAPASSWFFAEGATGSFFDLFLLLANADATDANVQITYLLPLGAPIVKTYTVPAQSRVTINVDFEDPALKDTPVSSIVESKNGVPIIAERAMWWPSPNWYEAHLSAGATTTGTTWALADGSLGTDTETYVLIANTSATAGTADVTLYFIDGTSQTKTFALPANSRVNVQVSQEFPTAPRTAFGTIIKSSGPPIVVERAIYTNANGQVWAAGSDALGTKLQ